VGGASRNAKKRQQELARQRLAAAGISPPQRSGGNRTTVIAVVAVLAVAVLVGLGVSITRGSSGDETPVAPTYAVATDGAVITAGPASAPVVVDIYSDYIRPACERFERRYGAEITQALNAGQITVRHHAVGLLDQNSDPAGYSSRAANASVCAADAGIFPAYHGQLFAEQPAGGGPGLSDEQLVAFGTELGAPAGFAECVTSGTNSAAVAAETQAMIADPAVRNAQDQVATPTVLVGGARVDLGDTGWLANAIGG
jgi:protein-disulfide isomerase